MFPNNSSVTRPPPSLLPGSDGTRSPAFSRYYEAAKTTGLVLRHSVCHVAPQYLGLISAFRSPVRGNRRASARVFVQPVHPRFRCLRPKDAFGSPKFPANPSVPLPCSRTPVGPRASLCTALRCWSPQNATSRTPDDDMSFVALSHGLSTGCLRFVPPSRTTTQNSLPAADRPFRVGFFMPTEFVRRVSSLSRFPSPRAYLGAMHSAFCLYAFVPWWLWASSGFRLPAKHSYCIFRARAVKPQTRPMASTPSCFVRAHSTRSGATPLHPRSAP